MKSIDCPFCSKQNGQYIYPSIVETDNIYGFNYVHCDDCGVAYLNPMPDEDDLTEHYRKTHMDRNEKQNPGEFKIDPCRKAAIDSVGLSKDDTVLDVGCGKGEVLYCLMKEGFNIEGVDPYFRPIYDVPELNERIHTNNLKEAGFPDGGFSVVMMWSVMEHISNPIELLEEVARVTKSGGRLVISVPNFKTLQHRLVKEHWPGFGPPEHLFVYSPDGLSKLLGGFGFKPRKRLYDPIFDQWMLKNSIYRYLQSRSEKRMTAGQTSKNFSKAERSLIGVFSFMFVRLESLIGNSSTLNMVYVKD